MTINDICQQFSLSGEYVSCREVKTGNINSTYLVRFISGEEKHDYILQRINKHVFKKPEKVMENILSVTEYVRSSKKKCGLPTHNTALHVYKTTKDERPYFKDNFGDYWRCYRYIENSFTFDSTDDLSVIEEVGKAFGEFQNALDGYPAKSLYISIPDFHNTPKRYERFSEIVRKDKLGRKKEVVCEIDRILSFKESASVIQNMLDAGKLPLRVTHNDTKCNNVSFDKDTGKSLAVLDLDTVMPGAIAFDFGDAVRSIASTREEDDPDFKNVFLDLDKYAAFAKGFVLSVKEKLTPAEKETLNLGVFTLTVELAMRFLGDYVNGDKYFKINYPWHNLDRARNQLALAEDILVKRTEMDRVLDELLRSPD